MEPLYQASRFWRSQRWTNTPPPRRLKPSTSEFEHLPFAVDPARHICAQVGLTPGIEGQRLGESSRQPPSKPGEKPQGPPPPKLGRVEVDRVRVCRSQEGRLPMGNAAGSVELRRRRGRTPQRCAWCWTRHLSRRTPAIRHSRPAARLRIGRTGKVFVHMGTQSTVTNPGRVGTLVEYGSSQIVLISEYTGGGFGSQGNGIHLRDYPGAAVEKGRSLR
jgi:hypothetical protein